MAQPSLAGFLMFGLGHERRRAARRRRVRRGAAVATAILTATLSASALAGGAAPRPEKHEVKRPNAPDAPRARPAPATGSEVLSLIPQRAREFLDPPRLAFPILARPEYGDGIGAGRGHEGQDMFAAPGTPLVAVSDAVVLETGNSGGRGNYISIYDSHVNRTFNYFHMMSPALASAGEHVRAGQQLGRLGCTGSCWGYHLHFEERAGRSPYGPMLDPLPLLQKLQSLRAG